MDLSSGIAGGYCSKVLVDAGAEVVKLKPPDGDPLRRWAIGRRLAVPTLGGDNDLRATGIIGDTMTEPS